MAKNDTTEKKAFRTRDQARAERAYAKVARRQQGGQEKEYRSFALSFPALVHSCGLVQAVAFAQQKGRADYLEDLAAATFLDDNISCEKLAERSRTTALGEYMLLSRNALDAAGWIKRYAEALLKE